MFSPISYKNSYCSEACQVAFSNANRAFNDLGPCPTCGERFRSRNKRKIFCSIKCYVESDQFKQMAKENGALGAQRMREKADAAMLTCFGCGNEFPRRSNAKGERSSSVRHARKYCTKQCRRRYFSERFDRWIANPENVALPQNFDEFLSRNELSCPVSGCGWTGIHLGLHVNANHGISARDFKILCGFNVSTGLVGEDASAKMSEKAKMFCETGVWPSSGDTARLAEGREKRQRARSASLECREHLRKTRALDGARPSGKTLPCLQCGVQVEQLYCGRRLYCSTSCRSLYYETRAPKPLSCAHCGSTFMGRSSQQKRAAKNLPVCCSHDCRNRMNIAATLAWRSRGRAHAS